MDTTQTIITIGTTIATTLAAKGIESPGKSLGNLWDIAIGNKIAAAYEKSKFKHSLDIEDFKNKLINNVSSIKRENLQDPKISIVGPALEASKYYFEEEEIREMFANLIASSMDSTYNGLVQHSFVEIIKQLSPHDAKLFNSFSSNEPISDIRIENSNGNGFDIFLNFYISDNFNNPDLNAISIENLKRLGVIDVSSYHFIEKSQYEHLLNSKNFLDMQDYYKINPLLIEELPSELKLNEKIIKITPLGKAFKKICIKDSL